MTGARQPASLGRKRLLARAALWHEQLWPAIWPALGVIGAYACAALMDLPALLPPWPRLGLLAVVLLASAVLLWRGLRRVVRPSAEVADRRLERDSGLRHRPLAALTDTPAAPTPEAEALWRVHVERMAAVLPRLRVTLPRPGLARRDQFALRAAVLLGLVAGLVIAGPDAPTRLVRGFLPSLPSAPAGPGLVVQAWVTPPAYTGLPPVLLKPEMAAARVPAGSRLTVSLTGDRSQPTLGLGGASTAFHALDATSWQAEGELKGCDICRVAVTSRGGAVASWALTLIPDQAPVPAFTEPPAANMVDGQKTLQSRFAWQAVDDYGVTSLQAELRLEGRPGAPPLVVTIPLAGSPKSAHGVTTPDLTAHPWAGLPVIAKLQAKDALDQLGESAPATFTLPAREFHNPVAQALIDVRRQLSLTPEDRGTARVLLDGVADHPEAVDNDTGVILNLRTLSALLHRGRGQAAVEEAQARMWQLALALEENAVERTAQALERAREALREAMDPNQAQPPNQAELDRKVQELRDAIQRRLEALAEQARRDGNETPFDPSLPQMNAQQLDRMAQQLQQSLNQGRQDDAKRQMAELEQLLQQLQNARPETGEERERRRAEGRQRGRQQMSAVQDMVQREGQVLDRSENRAGAQPPPFAAPPFPPSPFPAPAFPAPRAPQQGGQQQNNQQQNGQQRAGDAKAQQAMRRALGELMQRYGDLTGEIPAPLGEADQAMRDAGQALADGRDAAAGAAARRAIEALQRGGQQMSQQLSRQFGRGQQQGEEGEGEDGSGGDPFAGMQNGEGQTTGPQPGDQSRPGQRRSARRDPLGRPLQQGTSGAEDSGDVHVPDDMEQARTRQLQDELRRRGAERTRPQPELDYIDRLLKPF